MPQFPFFFLHPPHPQTKKKKQQQGECFLFFFPEATKAAAGACFILLAKSCGRGAVFGSIFVSYVRPNSYTVGYAGKVHLYLQLYLRVIEAPSPSWLKMWGNSTAMQKNREILSFKCALKKTFRLSLRCKKRLALSCWTFYEFGVDWNGANTFLFKCVL